MGREAEAPGAGVPALRLDGVLEELQTRLDALRDTRDRIRDLLGAVLAVGRELDLGQALRQIVEAAVTLVDAEFGALGVIGEDGRFSRFIPVGMTEEQIRRIGALPSGHGVLGELIRGPRMLRLAEISEHPSSYGFPSHHPPMHTFLGMPIRGRNKVYGNLYLTQKRGDGQFDAEDESVLGTLAVAAGVAIDNARLYRQSRLQERWLAASAEITGSLLSGSSADDVLALSIGRATAIAEADLAVVATPTPDPGHLKVRLAVGLQAAQHRDLALPFEGTLMGEAARTGALTVSADVHKDQRITTGPPRWEGLGPALAVPVGVPPHALRGVLMLARSADKAPFDEDESAPLVGFAGQVALAMELAERRRDSEQISLLRERDRIATDLRDLSVRRLIITGMTLQGGLAFIDIQGASDRVRQAVDELDETARIIRSVVFGQCTHQADRATTGLPGRAAESVERATALLGFAPTVSLRGPLDREVPPALADEAVAVLGEALSNVARHARATAVEVGLIASRELSVTVTDNGCGLPENGRRSGLANLAERAARLGGSFEVTARPDGGTRLVWRVPLPAPGRPDAPPGPENGTGA
ncbi:sensor histidine kinase [Kitasatospora sp. NPDC001159]